MTEITLAKIPRHLRKYIVEQNYARYTPEDQAVWRYIMRQLISFLSEHAHSSYLGGLKKTGLQVEKIPLIDDIDEHLEEFGWGAVPVSGFIPPAAFMEFQSIGVLPIASDMRTLDHLLYTPAPDIVHEAAGHAPILVDTDYAAYLRKYGEVARHAIISKEDMAQYQAIRELSDVKENPSSLREDIARAETNLHEVNRNMSYVSEAALLSRMNWWTAEYGLIGPLGNPKIFGAGLLSSVGEARAYLNPAVKKIALTVDCVDYSYDITEPQPQLFVTEDFQHLGQVLGKLADRLSYRRGGIYGLEAAIEAGTVNTVQLNSGVQVSGVLKKFLISESRSDLPIYLQFEGPSQLALEYAELPGQGASQHSLGFSTPVGLLKNHQRCLSSYSAADLGNMALRIGERSRLVFEFGIQVEGLVHNWLYKDGKLVLISWKDCRVTLGDLMLFDPKWGDFDMAVGSRVTSVFGGPADHARFGETTDFSAERVPNKSFSEKQLKRHRFFQELHILREASDSLHKTEALLKAYLADPEPDWLQGIELLELCYKFNVNALERDKLLGFLNGWPLASAAVQDCVKAGIALAATEL